MAFLTPAQFVELRLDLEKLKGELTSLVELTAESAKPVDLEEPIGRLSRMDAMQNQQMAQANERSHSERLDRVQNALEAMDRGEYGTCGFCREAIPFERLKPLPETQICVSCQERGESGVSR